MRAPWIAGPAGAQPAVRNTGQPISVRPGAGVIGVPGADQVHLPYRSGHGEGVLGHVRAQGAVGDVDVVVGSPVHGHRQLRRRNIEGLLRNDSDIQPDTIHADTQGQSLPVFGLAALPGFELLPRIRNWHDLIFYRHPRTRYQHIDALFGDNAIDWDLIEKHWTDLLRTAISIREGRVSSVTLLRRLGNHSRKNRLYRAFRELGRVIRTITLLRYLSEPELREQITAITNKAEAFHGYSEWLMVGGKLIGHNDPDHQELVVKFNELMANCAIYSTALDITDAATALAAEGHPVDHDDLATITPYITHTIRRLGDLVLDLNPPDAVPATRLDLEPAPCSPQAPSPDREVPAAVRPSAVTSSRRRRGASSVTADLGSDEDSGLDVPVRCDRRRSPC